MRLLLLLTLLTTACATTIRPGEAGVRTQFGKMTENSRGPGLVVYSPFGTRFIRVPIRTRNVEIALDLPTAEGHNVQADVSILYRLDPSAVPRLVET